MTLKLLAKLHQGLFLSVLYVSQHKKAKMTISDLQIYHFNFLGFCSYRSFYRITRLDLGQKGHYKSNNLRLNSSIVSLFYLSLFFAKTWKFQNLLFKKDFIFLSYHHIC